MLPLFVTIKFYEIVTFLVILTFQPEMGASIATPADQKNAGGPAGLIQYRPLSHSTGGILTLQLFTLVYRTKVMTV